jgi:hypothetical protein
MILLADIAPPSYGKAHLHHGIAVLAKVVVILASVRRNGQPHFPKSMITANHEIRLGSSKVLRRQGKVRNLIKNFWRWIRYYCRRRKIYLHDGTVLMPSIRFYDLLDFASGDENARRHLR